MSMQCDCIVHDDASNFIIIVDNNGYEKRQRIEYIIADVQGETVYVTDGGLRELNFILQEPGMVEAIASVPNDEKTIRVSFLAMP